MQQQSQLPYGHWNEPPGIEKLVGKTVSVTFRDGQTIRGRVLASDGDLGTVTLSWEDGPRSMTCTFSVKDAPAVKAALNCNVHGNFTEHSRQFIYRRYINGLVAKQVKARVS